MKKLFWITLALCLSVDTADVSAQSFLKKLEKTVKKEVEKKVTNEVKKRVNKGLDKATDAVSGRNQSTKSNSKTSTVEVTLGNIEPNYGVATGKVNGHEWVDLGLPSGTRWATCNVGATAPSQAGGLYAWGETATKTSYMPENSKTHNKNIEDFSGNAAYDVATAKWGKGWRMPTKEEFEELVRYCSFPRYEQLNGRWGQRFTHRLNGRSIFLPATGFKERGSKHQEASGCGLYWTSTPQGEAHLYGAHQYHFGAAMGEMGHGERSSGYGIRPVIDNDAMITVPAQGETNGHQWVDLGLPSGTKWATCNIDASSSEEFGETFVWAEITPVSDTTSPKNKVTDKEMVGIAGSTRYDAATSLWGKEWRIPNKAHFDELLENCTWEYTTLGRIKGCKVTSKVNGNYIFFPIPMLEETVTDWASTPGCDKYSAETLSIIMSKSTKRVGISTVTKRTMPCPIRPVTK